MSELKMALDPGSAMFNNRPDPTPTQKVQSSAEEHDAHRLGV